MSNKFKDISIKSTHTTFWWCCQYKKFHPNDIKMEGKILYTLLSAKWMDTFEKLRKKKYWLLILQMKEKK